MIYLCSSFSQTPRIVSLCILFQSRRKRARTPTPGHYLGLKSTRDYGKFEIVSFEWLIQSSMFAWCKLLLNSICSSEGYRGDRGRYRGGGSGRDDYPYRGERGRSPRRSPYRGGRDYSPRHSPPPYGGRTRRDRSRSLPYSPYGSPDRRYARGSRWWCLLKLVPSLNFKMERKNTVLWISVCIHVLETVCTY